MKQIKKLLIANRGEIACRIARSARRHGIATVAVHSDVDAGALHVQACDEAVLLGPEGRGTPYLDVRLLIEAAQRTGADAVHPGYGFLSERAEFATAVQAAGLIWVGPPPEVMASLGRKDAAKALARALGVPVVPGFELGRFEEAEEIALQAEAQQIEGGTATPVVVRKAREVGFPVLIKAVAGGGGRGMRVVRHPDELPHALELAAREAEEAFGDGTLLIEKFIEHGRHVEVQILADTHGKVLHLGERECSVQRRHQKLIEESPSPAVTPELRRHLTASAVRLAHGVNYVSAGTVEFLLDADTGQAYFLEVNTRIQVEHPVTELVTGGLDLIAWQLAIAQGLPLTLDQKDVQFQGHAIEARLCAEDPLHGFLPQAGPVLRWQVPEGEGVRVDHGLHPRDRVPVFYDALVGKVIAWGPDRQVAVGRLRRALEQTRLLGLANNRAYLLQVLGEADFVHGRLTTHYVTDHPPVPPPQVPDATLVAAACWLHGEGLLRRFRSNPHRPDVTLLTLPDGSVVHVALEPRPGRVLAFGVSRQPDPLLWRVPALSGEVELTLRTEAAIELRLGGMRRRWDVAQAGDGVWLVEGGGPEIALQEGTLLPAPQKDAAAGGSVIAPGAAVVVEVYVTAGQQVAADAPLVTLEAMKMLTVLRAPRAAVVRAVRAAAGESVAAGTPLVELETVEEKVA